MLAMAAAGAIAFLVFLVVRASRRPARRREREEDEALESPAGVRLLGLALLVVLFLVTAWAYAPPALAHALVANLLYPAAFALALVLLFDKASRAWAVKGGAVSFREWLYCDAFTILLVLGYLNLLSNAGPAEYSALFWDALHVALFVFAFWLVDRKFTRLRWLVGLAYFTLLPVLLWLWRLTEGVASARSRLLVVNALAVHSARIARLRDRDNRARGHRPGRERSRRRHGRPYREGCGILRPLWRAADRGRAVSTETRGTQRVTQ